MNFPTAKELKKLAAACRKAGIKSFKCDGYEVTFTDYPPEPKKTKTKEVSKSSEMADVMAADFEEEALTQDQLLNWSSGQMSDEETITA